MACRGQAPVARLGRGQASVELLAAIPALILAVLVAAQLALAGHALWSAGVAARAGARAARVGSDAERVARAALPPYLRAGAEISGGGPVRVRVRVPALLPGVPAVAVAAGSSLEPGRG